MSKDYYPFGMVMQGRKYSAGSGYRYGFNGKEEDDEVKGDGNQQDYGMRIYDTRLGRFLTVDPLTQRFPELTPYQFASNRPIDGIDLDGLEYTPAQKLNLQKDRTLLKPPIIVKIDSSTDNKTWTPPASNLKKPEFKQGGYMGTDEYKIVKARVDQAYVLSQYAPITGDLHDIKDAATNLYKGDFVAAGMSAVFLIPGADLIKPVKSLVKTDKQILKFAKETFEGNKALSREATELVDKYRKGLDGGIGGHEVFKGVSELRGKNGARVYYRETKEGVEILGYSNKNNQDKVISRLKSLYEK